MSAEKLHFKIELGGTYWRKAPKYTISVNGQTVVSDHITTPSNETSFIEFDAEVLEGPCSLKIRLENKDNSDTVQSADKTEILQDMLLNIGKIEIDEIDLAHLVFQNSTFTGDDPTSPLLPNCINPASNRTWDLPFSSPFYIWLLESI